jgi:bifunctional DNase/RNase
MPAKRRRLIFELSSKEKENKFKAVLSDAIQKAAALNLPIVYRDELCIKPNFFIHKYPNGRKLLIEQDSKNSTEKTVKVLS